MPGVVVRVFSEMERTHAELEPFNMFLPVFTHDAMSCDPEFYRIHEVSEGSIAKQEDVSGGRTMVVNIVDVGFLRPNEYVTGMTGPRAYCWCHLLRGRGSSSLECWAWP
jgi:hypothetical protein